MVFQTDPTHIVREIEQCTGCTVEHKDYSSEHVYVVHAKRIDQPAEMAQLEPVMARHGLSARAERLELYVPKGMGQGATNTATLRYIARLLLLFTVLFVLVINVDPVLNHLRNL